MFFEALEKLSPNDIRMLAAKGVPHSRVSDWKARRRVPTRPQAYALATVAGLDFDKLERELTAIEMEQDARKNAGFAMLLATVGKLYFSAVRGMMALLRTLRHEAIFRAHWRS